MQTVPEKEIMGHIADLFKGFADPTRVRNQGLFDAKTVNSLVTEFLAEGDAGHGSGKNFSKLVWSYFVFQQWYDAWIG